MLKNWLAAFRSQLKRHLTNENRSRVTILGAGCVYVYLNGVWLYVGMQSGTSSHANRLDGPVPQLFMSDILSHFSPYMLPSYVKGGFLEEIKKKVSSDSTELRDRVIAYLTLNKVLRNPICVRTLFSGNQNFGPIMRDILEPKEVPSSSSMDDTTDKQEPELLFNIKMSCLERYLEGITKEERQVNYDDILLLLKLSKLYNSHKSQEMVSKVLRLFLENEENCVTVVRKEFEIFESCSLIQEEAPKVSELVLKYLYSVKPSGSMIFSILNEDHETVVNNAISIDLINKAVNNLGMVLSPLHSSKISMASLQTLLSAVEISYAYAFLRILLSRSVPGAQRGHTFKIALINGLKTTRGLLIYHLIYLLQDKIIKSERYYTNESFMLPMSALICSTSWMSLGLLTVTHPYFLLPALVHKIFC